jgi:hypothetical protein
MPNPNQYPPDMSQSLNHHHLLSRFSFSWYFSWTSGTPHHSGFKFQSVELSLLCAVTLVQNQLNAFLVSCPVFFSSLVTILLASIITGMTKHFVLHIHWTSVLRVLYFNFFWASFCITFLSDDIATFINKEVLCLVFNYYIWPIGQKLCMFIPLDYIILPP